MYPAAKFSTQLDLTRYKWKNWEISVTIFGIFELRMRRSIDVLKLTYTIRFIGYDSTELVDSYLIAQKFIRWNQPDKSHPVIPAL